MKIKTFAIIFLTILIIGSIRAETIASINPSGELGFLKPNLQEILNTVMCASGPVGAITCIEQYLQGKIIGFVSGKVMEQISKTSPEIYKAITTYNSIKGYIDKGSSVLEELKINEKGQVEEGSISFGEDDYSIKELFTNSSAEDITVSNADYDFETRKLELKEGGSLKIKVENAEGKSEELVYENIKEGYLRLNESGAIDEAKFISSKESTYKFGDYEPIKVGADTQVEYKDGKLTVYGKDKNFLYGNLNISLIGDYVDFSRNKIQCLDCRVGEIELKGIDTKAGILSQIDKGYLVEYGEAIYEQNSLLVSLDRTKVLIANPDADLSDYSGNWLKQTSDSLELKSSEEGHIDLEILEGHEILNTDKKDLLIMGISKGDGLKIEKREDEGLIPNLIHESNEDGETKISNDKIDLVLNREGMTLIAPEHLSIEDLDKKYQSVAIEIQSDSPAYKNKLRINSYSQFIMLSEDNKELVSYNKYDLPVSALIEDNSLQTIEKLREKYPNMKFRVPFSTPTGLYGNERTNELTEENLPPYMVYITDEFLKTNPNPESLNEIIYNNEYNAQAEIDTPAMIIGRAVTDPYQSEGEIKIREMTSPIQMLRHEYEHRMDMTIQDKEFDAIGSLGDLETKSAIGEVNSIKKEIERLKEMEITTPEELDMRDRALLKQETFLRHAQQKVMKEYYRAMPENKMLRQSYNELAINGMKNLLKSGEFKNQMVELSNNVEKNYVNPELNDLVKQIYHKDIITYLKEELKYESNEKALEEYEKNSNNLNTFVISQLRSNKEDFSFAIQDKISLLKNLNEEIDGLSKEKDYFNHVNLFSIFLSDNPELEKERKQVDSIIRMNSGIPYLYSLKSYGASGDAATSFYMELATTYREQPIEKRKALVQSGNKLISDMFKRLTQLAFDSGKMGAGEFQEIMGRGFCKRGDCSDKICIEYKFLCCENNPISPNC